ncbi:MAG: Ig-like domain repeat protein [Acidobacteriaceae bacterium]
MIAGSLVLTDTNLNAASPNYAQQTISLNGTGQAEPPTITFSVPNQSYGTPPFTVAATSNSSGAITYSVVSGPATISGSTVTLTATGTVVLQASQAATTSYLAATQNVTFTVMAGVPAITFTVANQTYGASPFAVSASSNSTGAITYSVVSGPATISGSTVTLTGVGTVVLQASQAAAAYYTAGVQNATFTVAGTPPTITFAVANHTYGNAPFTVAATSNSSGTITYSVVSGPATISGATITLTGAGTVVLQASQAAVGNYAAGTQTATFTVAGAAPTITFAVANQTFGATPFAVAATSSSTGAFTYTVVSGPATISGSTVTLTGIGPVVLQASEAAAGNYSAGTQNATFTVAAAAPTITFTVANQTFGVAAFAVAATSNSTGAFTYSVVSGPATISGSTVTLTGIGAVVLQASEVAAGNYLAGTQNATFTVAAATPTITFTVANQTYGNAPFAVSATSNSPGVIAYSVVSGPATISGSTVTLTGAGTVVLQASQVAAGNYAAGTQNATFTVAAATPTITFTVANHTYGNAPFAVSATSNSSGAITYSVVSGPATISGSTVTLTGAGTVVLQASQAAAGNYAAATQNATFTVAAVAPTITFAVANQTFGATPFTVAATSNSSGSFTYSVVSGPATVSGSTVTLTGIGTVVLQASEVAAGNYLSGTQNATFTVAAGAPTITFTVANQTYGAAPFTVAATSNSTGAITYSVVSGPATISGSTVTLTAAGSVVLQASQAAAGNFLAGTQNASFTVAEESQTITFAAPASPVNYGVAPISLSASASSGLAVVFSVLSGPASVSGSTLTITGAGTVVVVADQSGNTTTYAAAAEVTHSITVNKISPTAGLTASPNPSLVQGTVTLTATVASSVGTPTGSVVFSDSGTTLGTANLTGGIATLTTSTLAAGSHSITAAYSGDSNFNSVSSTAVSQTVEDFTLTIGASGSSQSVQPGGTATYSLPMTPSGGATFPAAVSFSASGVPTGFTATFSPSSLTAGSAATNVALMIQVPTTAMLDNSSRPDRGLPLIALSLLILPFLGRIRRSRPWLSLLALLVMVMAGAGGLATLTGCGGGGSGSSGESSNQPQTYNIIVTATSGTLSHSTTVTLVVE